ncbi:hypothetical protein HMPREF2738_02399 [Clostridiales bacterium KLE1615]|nr:hypothetical protein HMPREF2738_02399 [Clostridiales bacterium KLE1615]
MGSKEVWSIRKIAGTATLHRNTPNRSVDSGTKLSKTEAKRIKDTEVYDWKNREKLF